MVWSWPTFFAGTKNCVKLQTLLAFCLFGLNFKISIIDKTIYESSDNFHISPTLARESVTHHLPRSSISERRLSSEARLPFVPCTFPSLTSKERQPDLPRINTQKMKTARVLLFQCSKNLILLDFFSPLRMEALQTTKSETSLLGN